jgi:hypothetical protein
MEINLTDQVRSILLALFLFILPLICILIGIVLTIENVWYFVLSISWFGAGVIFYNALN